MHDRRHLEAVITIKSFSTAYEINFSKDVIYCIPVSFHIITHNLSYWHLWFDFFVCVDCDHIWSKFHINSMFRNIFTERNGDVFSTYFSHWICSRGQPKPTTFVGLTINSRHLETVTEDLLKNEAVCTCHHNLSFYNPSITENKHF